jgi:hypothetical protein
MLQVEDAGRLVEVEVVRAFEAVQLLPSLVRRSRQIINPLGEFLERNMTVELVVIRLVYPTLEPCLFPEGIEGKRCATSS